MATKRYKAWVSDFDGTIANSNLTYSDKVKEAITSLIERGFSFSIATGRPYSGRIKDVCTDLMLTSPQIVSGGSAIIDPKTDEYIWQEPIEEKTSKAVVDLFIKNGYTFGLEDGRVVFTKGANKLKGYGPDADFHDIKDFDFKTTLKMVLFDANGEDLSSVANKLSDNYSDLHLVRSGVRIEKSVYDITSDRGTKHLAVLALSKILKIKTDEIIGIGDGYNDYPLLTACGFKVAMANAPTHVKEIADLVVPDVEKNGFVTAIEQISS